MPRIPTFKTRNLPGIAPIPQAQSMASAASVGRAVSGVGLVLKEQAEQIKDKSKKDGVAEAAKIYAQMSERVEEINLRSQDQASVSSNSDGQTLSMVGENSLVDTVKTQYTQSFSTLTENVANPYTFEILEKNIPGLLSRASNRVRQFESKQISTYRTDQVDKLMEGFGKTVASDITDFPSTLQILENSLSPLEGDLRANKERLAYDAALGLLSRDPESLLPLITEGGMLYEHLSADQVILLQDKTSRQIKQNIKLKTIEAQDKSRSYIRFVESGGRSSSVEENWILANIPEEQRKGMKEQFKASKSLGAVVGEFTFSSFSEGGDSLSGIRPESLTSDFEEKQIVYERAVKAFTDYKKRYLEDPQQYSLTENQMPENLTTPFQQASFGIAHQRLKGVPENQLRYLTNAQRDSLANSLDENSNDPEQFLLAVDNLQSIYNEGEDPLIAHAILAEVDSVASEHLPKGMSVVLRERGAGNPLARSMALGVKNYNARISKMGSMEKKSFNQAVNTSDFNTYFSLLYKTNPESISRIQDMQTGYTALALEMSTDGDYTGAIKRAFDGTLGKTWHPVSSSDTALKPRVFWDNGEPQYLSVEEYERAFFLMKRELVGGYAGSYEQTFMGSSLPEGSKQFIWESQVSKGFWENSPDNKGFNYAFKDANGLTTYIYEEGGKKFVLPLENILPLNKPLGIRHILGEVEEREKPTFWEEFFE